MALSVGDLLVFAQSGIIYHFDTGLNFIDSSDGLSVADRALWAGGTVSITSYTGLQIGNYIYITGGQLHKIYRVDLNLQYVDDVWTADPAQNGIVTGIAYSKTRNILYVATFQDLDAVAPASNVSVYAINLTTGIEIGRYHPLPSGNQGVIALVNFTSLSTNGGATNLAISPDENTLYITQTNNTYAIWASEIEPNGTLGLTTTIAYIDGKQPTYWRDVRNWDDDPLNLDGCGVCPGSPGCTHFVSPPHQFEVLDDGSSYTGPGADGPSVGGAKLNTRQYFGVYNGMATQHIVLDGQLSVSARFICTDSTGRLYLNVEQVRTNQFMQIQNYPSASLFYGIMQSNYSAEPHFDVFPAGGGGRLSRGIVNPINTSEFTQAGCYASSGQTNFPVNPIFGLTLDIGEQFAYTVQTAGGVIAGGLNKVNVDTGLPISVFTSSQAPGFPGVDFAGSTSNWRGITTVTRVPGQARIAQATLIGAN